MKKRPLVSVIVPVYMVEKYIGECIHSIANQTYDNLEIMVIIDGSADGSALICKDMAKCDPRIHVIEKENGGVSSARNIGIRAATGDYLMFIDGDDWIDSEAIESMLQIIETNDVDACFCNCYYRNINEVIKTTETEGLFDSEELIKKHLHYRFIASPCLSLVSLKMSKAICFDEEIHTLEDWEYNFRVLNSLGKVSVVSKPYYHYRTVIGSASKSKLNDRKMSCFLIPEKVSRFIDDNKLPYANDAKYIPVFLINHILVILANTEYEPYQARKLCIEARKVFIYAFRSNQVLHRQKVYILMAAISPKLFCLAYQLKWRGISR